MDQDMITGNMGAVDYLTALLAGPLAGAKIRLFLGGFVPTVETTHAGFVAQEATFGGYPAGGIALTWSAVAQRAGGVAESFSNRAFFQATDAVTPNDIGGAWVEKAADGDALMYVVFPEPIAMNVALRAIALVVDMKYPSVASITVEV